MVETVVRTNSATIAHTRLKDTLRDLHRALSVLSHEHEFYKYLPYVKLNVPYVNSDILLYYKNNIMKYEYVISTTYNSPGLMKLLDIIHKFMQLQERVTNKQKSGDRILQIKTYTHEAMECFQKVSNSIIMRYWRNPKMGILVQLKLNATQLFSMMNEM
jgi:hypothetical protein